MISLYFLDIKIKILLFKDFGTMKWELVGCLALTWVLVIASLFKGNLFKFCFKNLEFIITRCLKSWKGLICDYISTLLCANSFLGLHGSKRCRLGKPHIIESFYYCTTYNALWHFHKAKNCFLHFSSRSY